MDNVADVPRFADQALADLVGTLAALPPMSASGDVAALRAMTDERSAQRPPGPAMATLDLGAAAGRPPVRAYDPAGAAGAPVGIDGRPVVVYLHGGGWTIGGLASHDRACRRMAARSGAVVVAVDYRLAPEHPAPASIDDTVAVLEWLADAPAALGGRAASVTVAGDSAGGALAALAALRTRGSAAAPDRLVTAYANTDLAAADATMVDLAHGFGLDAADVAWFNEQWVPDRTRWADPDVSPLHEPDLAGLCPATIVTCELDPLRSQGEAFAHRLVDAGVPVTIRREPGMVHNFLLWDLQSPACAAAGDRFADDLVAGSSC